MEDLFTPKAKEVLMLAQEEAKYFKHQTIAQSIYYSFSGGKRRYCGKNFA